jgi:four helix bundle protein
MRRRCDGARAGEFCRMANRPQDPSFVAWQERQSSSITRDSLWKLDCYREALFALHSAKEDVGRDHSRTGQSRGDQLITAVASIGANIAEGYGRRTNADRRRFFSYALGSSREATVWYHSVPIASEALLENRLDRLARISQMLLGMLRRIDATTTRPFETW